MKPDATSAAVYCQTLPFEPDSRPTKNNPAAPFSPGQAASMWRSGGGSWVPGIDAETAIRIAQARSELGAFSSIEDLGLVLDVPARDLETMRAHVIVLPRH